MGVWIAVAAIVNRPVARLVLEQPTEIENAGALLVQIELTGKSELIALGNELGAAGMGARRLVPEALAVPFGRSVGECEARVGYALLASVAFEVARGLISECLAALVCGGRDGGRTARGRYAASVEVVDGHGVCLLSGKRTK